MTISQVARLAGVGVETVRFYEREGLLDQPARPDTGYRQYSLDTVSRIRFIKRAKELNASQKWLWDSFRNSISSFLLRVFRGISPPGRSKP